MTRVDEPSPRQLTAALTGGNVNIGQGVHRARCGHLPGPLSLGRWPTTPGLGACGHETVGRVLRRDMEQARQRQRHQCREDRAHGAERSDEVRRRLPARLLHQRGRLRQLRSRPAPGRGLRLRSVPQRDRLLPVPGSELRAGRRDLHRRLQPGRLHRSLAGRHGREGRVADQGLPGRGTAPRGGSPLSTHADARGRVRREHRGVQARPLPRTEDHLPRCLRHRGRSGCARLRAGHPEVPRRPAERPRPLRSTGTGYRRDQAEVRADVLGSTQRSGRSDGGSARQAGVVRGRALRCRRRLRPDRAVRHRPAVDGT